MDKILEDLEDFQLPNKVKDEITESKKIYQSIILQDLYFFCTQHQNIKNLDINNFKKLFTKKYLAKCRIAKV